MSAAETLYTVRFPFPNLYERERAQPVSAPVYRNGALVAPASGTFSLYKPDGTALVPAAAVVVTGSVATYTVPAATLPSTLTPLGDGWREEWALLFSGETSARLWRRTAALVRRAPFPTVTDADMVALYPDIATQLGNIGTSFQAQIDAAWGRILRTLLRRGMASYLIVDQDSLHDWLENETLAAIYRSFFRGSGTERWKVLWDDHAARATAAATTAAPQIDTNHDGKADDTSRTAVGIPIHPNAAPSRSISKSSGW